MSHWQLAPSIVRPHTPAQLLAVGAMVGAMVGLKVGCGVVDFDGLLVGTRVGVMVGTEEGRLVG